MWLHLILKKAPCRHLRLNRFILRVCRSGRKISLIKTSSIRPLLNPEHSPEQEFGKVSWEVTPASSSCCQGPTNRNFLSTEGTPSLINALLPALTHLRDKEKNTCLICAILDPQKALAGSEDLRDECWMRGASVTRGQVEKLGSLLEEEAEAPGSS